MGFSLCFQIALYCKSIQTIGQLMVRFLDQRHHSDATSLSMSCKAFGCAILDVDLVPLEGRRHPCGA